MYNLHTCVWRRARRRRSRDWLRWCVWFNERSLALVWATWAFVHGLNRTRRGDRETRHRRADTQDPSLLLSCLITSSTRPPLFIQHWYCSYTVGGGQSVKDVYLVMRVCRSACRRERAWMCIPLDVIAFQWQHTKYLQKVLSVKSRKFYISYIYSHVKQFIAWVSWFIRHLTLNANTQPAA